MNSSKEDPVFGGVNLLNKLLHDLDERGLVLSLAAFAEDALGHLLSSFLLPTESTHQLLEGFNAPLGTFSSRIKAAYSLGLIEKVQFDDLEHLRKMRNEFAHSWRPIDFKSPKIAAHIKALNYSDIDDRFPETPHAKFKSSLSSRLIELRSAANQIELKGGIKATSSRLFPLIGGKDTSQSINSAELRVNELETNLKLATDEKHLFFKLLHKRVEDQLYILHGQVPEERKHEVFALIARMKLMVGEEK